MQIHNYEGIKITDYNQSLTNDSLVVEAPLQININEKAYTVVMRTPGNDTELVRGLLFAEDIYKNNLPLQTTILEKDNHIPKVINIMISKDDLGAGYLNKRTLLSVSSCGICGKQQLEDLDVSGEKLSDAALFSSENTRMMFDVFRQQQKTFHQTGGSHAAGVFDENYQLLTLKEDIGRHNAVDKCVGDLLNKGKLKQGSFLLVSGRVSYEIVSKAFLAKIPVIVAVSACSSMAVDYAKELGICLIGFTREHKMTIYSNPTFLKPFTSHGI